MTVAEYLEFATSWKGEDGTASAMPNASTPYLLPTQNGSNAISNETAAVVVLQRPVAFLCATAGQATFFTAGALLPIPLDHPLGSTVLSRPISVIDVLDPTGVRYHHATASPFDNQATTTATSNTHVQVAEGDFGGGVLHPTQRRLRAFWAAVLEQLAALDSAHGARATNETESQVRPLPSADSPTVLWLSGDTMTLNALYGALERMATTEMAFGGEANVATTAVPSTRLPQPLPPLPPKQSDGKAAAAAKWQAAAAAALLDDPRWRRVPNSTGGSAALSDLALTEPEMLLRHMRYGALHTFR
jgi:hypothetical protein